MSHVQPTSASPLARILQDTAEELRLKFQKARTAVQHSGIVGQEGERIVAGFLRERLPSSIGVTTGEIIDIEGGRSKQTDVIVYDALRTPMIFSGEERNTNVVPAEGVLAVIEVKTHLRSGDIEGCLANCRSVKQRSRSAYFPQPIQSRQIAYGRDCDDLPIFYSVFADSSDNLYAGALNDFQAEIPVQERIDMLCCLDRGVVVNAGIDLSGGIQELKTVISARSLPQGGLANVATTKPLLIWYAMLATTVMRAGTRSIDIARYLADDLHFEAEMPGGAITRAMHEEALMAMAEDQSIDADILRRWQAKEPLGLHDLYEFIRMPGYTIPEDLSDQDRHSLELAITLAKALPFDEWAKLGLVRP